MFHLEATRYAGTDKVPVTIYPGLQMIAVDNRMFKPDAGGWPELQEIWAQYLVLLRDGQVDTTCQVFVSYSGSFLASGIVGPYSFFHIAIYDKTGENEYLRKYEGVNIMVYLKKIQRMVKRFIHARRRLVVLMALHDRLGRHSLLSRLPTDLLVGLALRV
jgi:hypothetical protein